MVGSPTAIPLEVLVADAPPLGEYVRHLRRQDRSELTIRHRVMYLLKAHAHTGSLLDATAPQLEAFLDSRNLSAASRTTLIADLGAFFKWACTFELIDRDPMLRVARPKPRQWRPKPIAEDHYQRAIDDAGDVMRAWMLLGGHAGLRCAEIADLTAEQVDFDARTLTVVGKGRKQRVLPMHARVADALQVLDVDRGPMFTRFEGDPYNPHLVSQLGRQWLHSCGPPASMHSLRHRFATVLYRQTHDIAIVGELLGHADLSTSRVYAEIDGARRRSVVDALD
jgi:site-specific recombinase XerD